MCIACELPGVRPVRSTAALTTLVPGSQVRTTLPVGIAASGVWAAGLAAVVGGDVAEVAEELDEDEEHAVATASRAAAAQHHTVFLSISIHLVGSRLPDRDPATGSNGIRTLARDCADPRTLSTRLHHDDSHPTVQHNSFHKRPSPEGCGRVDSGLTRAEAIDTECRGGIDG